MRTIRLSTAVVWLSFAGGTLVLGSCDSATDAGPQPASIGVTPNPLLLAQLGAQQLVPIVYDDEGALISGVTVSFSSDNEPVVTVTKGGLVKSVGPAGTASITLRAGAATETLPVTVVAVRSAISVTTNPVTLPQKTSFTVVAHVIDAIGAPVPGAALSYSTSDPNLFAVSTAGVVTSVGPSGIANLIIEHDTLQLLVPVVVTQVPTTLEVSPPDILIAISGQLQMAARVLDAVDAPVVGSKISFESSNTNRVTVTSGGLVKAVGGTGTASITVTSGALSKVVNVEVVAVAHPMGNIVAQPALSGSPWGVGVSSQGVVYVTTPGNTSLHQSPLASPQFSVITSSYSIALSIAFTASGETAFVSVDNGVKVLDVPTGTETASVTGFTGNSVFSVALSPDERTLAIGTAASLHFMDVGTRSITHNLSTPGPVNALVFSSDGMRLYASQFDAGIVGEFNMSSKSHIRDISTPGTPQGIGLSADGTTLFVSKEGLQASLEIVDLVTNAREEINIGHGCFGLAVARDDTEVWLACPGEVVAVDLTSRTIRTTVPTGGYNRRIAFSVDGLTAVVTNDEGKVYFIQ